MLILTRRPGESLFIRVADDVDPSMLVSDLFSAGPIEIAILSVKGNQVRVGTEASDQLTILREELM